jgi:hypothetical protein
MVMTQNISVWTESSRRELLPSLAFSPAPAISISAEDDLETAQFTSSIQLVTIPHKTAIPKSDLRLEYALVVEIGTTPDGYVIRSGYLDEDAFGLTYQEVYLEFLTSLRDRYYSLCRREDSLSPQDHSVLERFRDILVPKSS